ncbi:MAG: FAD binding domain-containing protein [Nitrospinota bacterium]|jgi:CO/xanthine dehydrogenase FAD-binding subunit|nr:FAD binding domain-containing protein [Nitrospinota bacterium]MDP6617939.1 FAD binding domain-containing protein [Nitrospinota bacterium]
MSGFVSPRTLQEAFDALADDGENLRLLSGATDVVVQVRDGRMSVRRYLNLSGLERELRYIREENGFIEMGALTTVSDLLRSDLIRRHARALRAAALRFGSVQIQIRNRATVAGNLGTASPAGEALPPLLALDAQVVLESASGVRDVSFDKYMFGPGKTARSSDELITAVRFPVMRSGETSFYRRLDLRDALAVSVAGVAAKVRREGSSPAAVSSARVALGAVAPTVRRAPEAEEALTAGPVRLDGLMDIGGLAARSASPISDVRASAEYRKALIPRLFYQGMYDVLTEG